MEEARNRPITELSDDQLLKEYRRESDRSGVTEEILRRGLELPDEPADPQPEDVEWSGQAGGDDPSSGALPKPF